jgi:hypothetical protein
MVNPLWGIVKKYIAIVSLPGDIVGLRNLKSKTPGFHKISRIDRTKTPFFSFFVPYFSCALVFNPRIGYHGARRFG